MSHHVAGGTLQGPDYHGLKTINQDSLYSLSENGVTVIAVADGAGSLEESHIGAQIASQLSAEETLDCLMDGNSLKDAIKCGIEKARAGLLERDDWMKLGCTLAVAVISDDGWAAGVVGDAFAVVSYEDGHQLIQPESTAEYVNETKLLTSSDYQPIYSSGDITPMSIAVASDGLIQSSLDEGEPLDGFWWPLINKVSEDQIDITSLLEYIKDQGKISDDATLVVATV